jgi:hypothetical protein
LDFPPSRQLYASHERCRYLLKRSVMIFSATALGEAKNR